MAAIIWVAVGLLLIAGEALSGDFVLLMLAGGALAAGGSSAVGADLWVSAIVFAVVSVLLLAVVRPVLKRHFTSNPMIPSGTDALVGASATVLEQVTHDRGLVQIGGERWTARTTDGQHIGPGTTVVVQRIDGATAVVERGK
ncbi:NfeD family protein [Calidifontibacter sp. DB0510]|uniref:NfeD family protein n=1 Tax=Metallococcus carri TaxID=1656884 RepID=A0A967B3N2_9MICO|nr:NfeD family protein [Metallococcus carri]NHN55062.1 NfeD family protein [Metallococcus carri]NOP36139.1 NfeD family protein [Calidifontibacter sp. DB2511S]